MIQFKAKHHSPQSWTWWKVGWILPIACELHGNTMFVFVGFPIQFSICCEPFLYQVDCPHDPHVALHDLSCCMNREVGSLCQQGELGPSPACPFAHHG